MVTLRSWLTWQFVAFFSVLILLGVDSTLARDARSFGAHSPFTINELPPGILRSQLLSLPPAAQNRALGWLHRFEFTEQDVPFLRVDRAGGIFYEDPGLDGEQAEPTTAESPAVEELALNEVFTLHSKPGASRVVYLDMDGHVVSGTAWNTTVDPLYMRPYDSDANEASFSQSELNAIAETWKRIAEDFAPFDIDVTTEEPSAFGPQVGHILVTRKADENGKLIYNCSCGGVAYVGVWGTSYYTDYQPALVFLDGLSGAHNISEAASHELGHNLSLNHDGATNTGYYSGHGSGYIDWGPIMGVGYYAQVSQWSKGEYAGANSAQDDLQLIADRLTYRNDDHEDLLFSFATPLTITDGIYVNATNPVTDPANIDPGNKGIIEHRSDTDLFYLDVGPGTVDLTITPAWTDFFASQSRRGMNLDVEAALYDEFGTLLALSNPLTDTYAQINIDVGAGRYILAIDGVGVGDPLIDGYSDYGSLGQFFITGTVPQDVVSTAPPPAPTDLVAIPNGDVNIDLLWTDPASLAANDETGYRIYRQVDGGTFVQIATISQNSQSYFDNNLASGEYVYQVDPYNSAGATASNQTQPPIVISVPSYTNASSENTVTGAVISGTYMDTTVSSGYERLAEQHQGGKPKNRVSQLEHIWNITGVVPGALVTLEVDAQAPANSDGDDYQFSYSPDGVNYVPLGLLLNGGSSQLMSVNLPVGTFGTVYVKVIDTDRTTGNGGQDSVDIYRIVVHSAGDPDDMPPVVTISAPQNNYSAEQGAVIAFSATGSDDEDGDLTSNISWHSDKDGEIGQGPDISVNNLSPGQHQIAAEVTDSAGTTGSDTITVTITQPDPPAGSLSVVAATSVSISELKAGSAETTITGAGFAGNMSVVFQNGTGPTPLASNVTVNSGSQMAVSIAAASGGPRKNRYWDVVVTDANGNSAVCPGCLMISR